MEKKNKLDLLMIAKKMAKEFRGLKKKEILVIVGFIKYYAEKESDNQILDLETQLAEAEKILKVTPLFELVV